MSTRTEQLIKEFGRKDHPLARTIMVEEVPMLVEALRKRLECTSLELDLSPRSLKILERRLTALKHTVQRGDVTMDDEETLRLMREVAAYLGQVMVANLGGKWDLFPGLWPTSISVPIPVETIKGDEVHFTPTRGFAAAHHAAYFWDTIGTGKEKGVFQKAYKMMTQRRWREQLR